MPVASGTSSFDSARNVVLLVRESAFTLAVLCLFYFLLFSPSSIQKIMQRAGIQSMNTPFGEIRAELDASEKRLAEADRNLKEARSAASQAQEEVNTANARIETIAGHLQQSEAQNQLLQISGQLRLSSGRLNTTTGTIAATQKAVAQSRDRQKMLLQRMPLSQAE